MGRIDLRVVTGVITGDCEWNKASINQEAERYMIDWWETAEQRIRPLFSREIVGREIPGHFPLFEYIIKN